METDLRSRKIQEVFDKALKLSKGGNLTEGYEICNSRIYEAYYTNEEWKSFLENMKENHKKAYNDFSRGNGGELAIMSRKGKIYPPKMASFASSSRFIYELSKDIPDFSFECKLPTSFRGFPASLDGFICKYRIFVEAKCHEIYLKSSSDLRKSYLEFYEYLKAKTESLFDFYVIQAGQKEKIHFKWNGKQLQFLDLKQLLCHMLGIAQKALVDDSTEISTLLYLVYRPDVEFLRYVPDERKKNAIYSIWKNEHNEVECIDFNLLYQCIVHYVYEKKKPLYMQTGFSPRIEDISKAFKFIFCDQNEYQKIINKIISTK